MAVQARASDARRRPILSSRLPASGNTALAASALIQAVLGLEFVFAGLDKLADPEFTAHFDAFVRASPGSNGGLLAPLIQRLVLPNVAIAGAALEFIELGLGAVLLVGAAEIARRRLSGPLGAEHGYEAPVALVAALAGFASAGLALSIFLLEGGVLPTITPGRAFTSAIPVELLIVAFGIAIGWIELGRFMVLRQPTRALPEVRRSATS
jgi:hypothetical protein